MAVVISFAATTRVIREQRVLIGAQKALGFTPGEIFRHYTLYNLSSAVLGILLGLVLAVVIVENMALYIFAPKFCIGKVPLASPALAAGQTGISLPVGSESWWVSLEEVTAEDIPGFVAVELAKGVDLQQRVAEVTDLPVDDIAAGAQERLEQDENEARTELDRIAEQADDLPNRTSQAPQFAAPRPESDWDEVPTPEPEPEPEPIPEDYTVSDAITGTELQKLLDMYQTVTVASGSSVTITASESVTVPAGKSLTIAAGGTMTSDGPITNYGDYAGTTTTTLGPQVQTTRAQVAAILMGLCQVGR